MAQLDENPNLTVCVATHNRSTELMQCLKSLSLLSDLAVEIIVVDDASDKPISATEIAQCSDITQRIKVIHYKENKGYIRARNEMARLARAPYILSLDDDARLFDVSSIRQALEILESDSKVGAVALSQANEDGVLLATYMQPTPVTYNCYAQSFIGFGHILRRDVFLKLGGYREIFQFFGEESEYCKRMLDMGFYVVHIPEARAIHHHSPIGRNRLVGMRNLSRNRCFDAIYNEPFIMMLFSVIAGIIKYARSHKKTCEQFNLSDSEGVRWLLRELRSQFPVLWQDRKPLKWKTYRLWLKIRKEYPMYQQDSLS